MHLSLLFKDELKGFYKTKVMMFLWVGLPLMAVIIHVLSPDSDGMPFSILSALLISSIGGTLASVMLAVSIITEKNEHVYDLFFIRPVKRSHLILSKFLAVYTCLSIAAGFSLLVSLVIDGVYMEIPVDLLVRPTIEALTISLSMMAVSSAVGVLIGVASPSVLVGVIVVIYGGNQIAALPVLPTTMNLTIPSIIPFLSWIPETVRFTTAIGLVLTMVMVGGAVALFNRKEVR